MRERGRQGRREIGWDSHRGREGRRREGGNPSEAW